MEMKNINTIAFLGLTILFSLTLKGQSVTIKEEIESLETYGFSKPNPVPILAENPKIFPYFKFEAYEQTSQKKDWKVVTLENDYIKVMVLPEIGGKVWGAIEKSTGEEFLYKNEVIKFRNIAMRGPWTSGGIEFNFGIIGHHPSTATPVDYNTRTNADGSVSCIVGATDLPSNTSWTVEIRLEKDKAYFETNASWYNASSLEQSYYNWMTGAAATGNDLEFFVPGNKYVEHNGDAHPWPIDEQGRNLAMYKNNNFGPDKSYHIVGERNDFFGGYYHDRKFGFGQWSPYEEMPGQKLWLWALSRSGGIWEDLLTDSDGQYIEFQAGRLFDQFENSGAINPISEVGFDPYMMDNWREIWFPYKEIGGMVDVSKEGVLNVVKDSGALTIGLNALQELNSEIEVLINGELIWNEKLGLKAMQIYSKTLSVEASDRIQVSVKGTELSYTLNSEANLIKRPFYSDKDLQISPSEKLLTEGTQALKSRKYQLAYEKLSELIKLDPSHRAGLVKIAELEYRRTDYNKAISFANTVLKMDTYDASANYMSGLTYRAMKDTVNAIESLGWAARDVKYRSVAFAQMAELYLASKKYEKAEKYANKAIDFNRYNLNAQKVLAISARKSGEKVRFDSIIAAILDIAPLDYFAQTERRFMDGQNPTLRISNEFPSETILRLAVSYENLGLSKEALQILSSDLEVTKNKLWTAYLLRSTDAEKSDTLLEDAEQDNVSFVSPFRPETLSVLEWATKKSDNWKFTYFLAQNYLAVGKMERGKFLLDSLGNQPDSDVFYRFRVKMNTDDASDSTSEDMKKALSLSSNDWKVWEESIQFNLNKKNYKGAYELSKKAYAKFPKNYNIGLAHAASLLNTGRFKKVISVLNIIQVLPYEHASESRNIYERAHISLAMSYLDKKNYAEAVRILEKSREWPENIGVGKPYSPDERPQNYLLSFALEKMGDTTTSKELLEDVVSYSEKHIGENSLNHLYGILAIQKTAGPKEKANFISELNNAMGDDSQKSELALNLFEKDADMSYILSNQSLISDDIMEVAKWALKNKP